MVAEERIDRLALTTLRALRIAASSTPGNGDENFAAAVGIDLDTVFIGCKHNPRSQLVARISSLPSA